MSYQAIFLEEAPDRTTLDQQPGYYLLEFGSNFCGHCKAAQPAVQSALAAYPDLTHRKVEDGPGRPLGRSYRVKLWPTLILLKDGQEIARVVRPTTVEELQPLLAGVQ